ncbi:MAG: arginine--tRNA ligase domain-containing protein, partial [Candidatus Kariarchaeaceae archaeon]
MFEPFEMEINDILEASIAKRNISLLQPPSPDLGDFCIVINQIAGKKNPREFASELIPQFETIEGISEVTIFETKGKKKRSGIVYLNFKIENETKQKLQIAFLSLAMETIFSNKFGTSEIGKNKTAIVEHTSANPISPIHVGNLRNSVHGDTLARILKHLGYKVYRHFYINDVGLQVSFVTVGYEILKTKNIRPEIKFDLWLGRVYAIMHNFYYIKSLKLEHEELLNPQNYSLSNTEIKKLINHYTLQIEENNAPLAKLKKIEKLNKKEKQELRELKQAIAQLKNKINEINSLKNNFDSLLTRFPILHQTLFDEVSKIDLKEITGKYLKIYETNSDPAIVSLFREITDWILETFKWTLKRFNIEFDVFDYESDLMWSNKPNEIIQELEKSTNSKLVDGNALRYTYPSESIKQMYDELELDHKSVPIKGKIPELQLRRKDGTALYASKDIAYSIQKYMSSSPHLIFNIISSEQILPQFQLLLPLFELGYKEVAQAMKHYSYELVELKGRPMSGRRAIYVTADEYYDETLIRARMAKRISDQQRKSEAPNNLEEWKGEMDILTKMTVASTRFPLIETSPSKKIILDLDRE